MSIAKQITPALVACAAAGWLAAGAAPAQAAAAPVSAAAAHPVRACTYRLAHVRPSSYLRVRKGPGLRFRPIGRLTTAGGRVAGSCTTTKGWVAVKTSAGRSGWAWGHYLRKVAKSHRSDIVAGPSLTCTYQLAHVRSTSALRVRRGPGLRFRPIGRLTTAGGRVAGSCTTTKGWVAVKTSAGRSGWAWGHYLRKVAKPHPAAPATVPSLGCTYQFLNQGPAGSLAVYNGPGTGYQPIGTLNAGGRFAGSCTTTNGWVAVKTSTGKVGWTPAQKLLKIAGR
ncbi:SH3 domain-containing protein [Microtetraspora fusca]|uniref:SH3 domain-containing protein n=1 Tax=Microtetraspora fusca TaxID=1997 RepID=A0ABW6UWX8_MICFU